MEKKKGNHQLQSISSISPKTLRLIEEEAGKVTTTSPPVVVLRGSSSMDNSPSPPPLSTVENSNSNSNSPSPDNDSSITPIMNIGCLKVTGKRSRDQLAEDCAGLKEDELLNLKSAADPTVVGVTAPATAAATAMTNNNNNNVDDEKAFKCTVCGKGYTSYKALGGHKSSHTTRVKREGEGTSASSSASELLKKKKKKKQVENINDDELIYGCNVCPSRYPSTKALKLHQRSHEGGKVILKIDLNQKPPEEEEDQKPPEEEEDDNDNTNAI